MKRFSERKRNYVIGWLVVYYKAFIGGYVSLLFNMQTDILGHNSNWLKVIITEIMADSLEQCRKITIRQFYNNKLEKTRLNYR